MVVSLVSSAAIRVLASQLSNDLDSWSSRYSFLEDTFIFSYLEGVSSYVWSKVVTSWAKIVLYIKEMKIEQKKSLA